MPLPKNNSTPLPESGDELHKFNHSSGWACPIKPDAEFEREVKANPGANVPALVRKINYKDFHENNPDRGRTMFLVPNNIHRFKERYKHSGFVAFINGKQYTVETPMTGSKEAKE